MSFKAWFSNVMCMYNFQGYFPSCSRSFCKPSHNEYRLQTQTDSKWNHNCQYMLCQWRNKFTIIIILCLLAGERWLSCRSEEFKIFCCYIISNLYILLTVQHLDAILGNDQLDALFLNVFILCLYMFRAANVHHQEGQIVLIHHLV
jgi:hypothetical protein